jgi:hypothetical protein
MIFLIFKGKLTLFSPALRADTPPPSPKCLSICYARASSVIFCAVLFGAKPLCAGAYSLEKEQTQGLCRYQWQGAAEGLGHCVGGLLKP